LCKEGKVVDTRGEDTAQTEKHLVAIFGVDHLQHSRRRNYFRWCHGETAFSQRATERDKIFYFHRALIRGDLRCFERCDVSLVLQKTADRLRHDLVVQLSRLQRNERVGPVECFSNAGNLREAHRSRPLHNRCEPLRKYLSDCRNFRPHYLEFLIERWIVDPVIQTATAKRVRKIA